MRNGTFSPMRLSRNFPAYGSWLRCIQVEFVHIRVTRLQSDYGSNLILGICFVFLLWTNLVWLWLHFSFYFICLPFYSCPSVRPYQRLGEQGNTPFVSGEYGSKDRILRGTGKQRKHRKEGTMLLCFFFFWRGCGGQGTSQFISGQQENRYPTTQQQHCRMQKYGLKWETFIWAAHRIWISTFRTLVPIFLHSSIQF